MKFRGYSREYTDAKMRRAEAELRNGKSFSEVCEIIRVDEHTFDEWARTLIRMGEQLSNSSLTKAVCPIFWMPHEIDRMEQIGSGVLLELFDEVFLLTSAHVTDASETGDLYIPGRQQIVPIEGHSAHNPVPLNGDRKDDRLDFAYYRLSTDLKFNLHDSFQPIRAQDVDPFDRPNERDYYTFVGYPWRKTVSRLGKQETEQFTFSGEIVSDEMFQRWEYSKESHYLIKFRRNKVFSARYKSLSPSPHPEGISGGGIFAWPKEVDNEPDIPALKLVGICHTYHSQSHLLAGTHVGIYLWGIQNNNPWLPVFSPD